MIIKSRYFFLTIVLTVFSLSALYAQDIKSAEKNKKLYSRLAFFELRGTNAIDAAIGSSITNGDLAESEFEAYFRIGYKRHITSHLNLNFTYNKYSVVFKDVYSEGFMSFDMNLELLISPYKRFTPYLFAGGGYNAANYFENTSTKVQGGLGFECIVTEGFGIKLFGEYNYFFSDELDGLIAGESDDAVWRMGLGINLYFGGSKKREKRLKEIETVINNNLIN
ncbi:Curli production assembly/transport component CsgG [Winogradskyella flava]|uniref:Curli production assembly/transport component CsgG n=1 Tax=Winogradskyella flava TaxID=1884876 RepID=UPI001FE776F5|nr:Curli production assembly/transport component CsgG [Winogradskyella flava]